MEVVGNVEDGRVIEGKGFKITGDVAAKLIRATETDIVISGSVRNGRLESLMGNITIQRGLVTNETISAPNGTIEIFGNIESGTTIYAKKIILHGLAQHVIIIGDEVNANGIISSQILGKKIVIESAQSKHSMENTIFVEVPNSDSQDKKSLELTKEIKMMKESVALLQNESNSLKKQTPIPIDKIISFLNTIAEIKAKSEIMSENDRKQFKAILPYMEIVKKYVNTVKEIVQKDTDIFKKEEEFKEIAEAIKQAKEGIGVELKYVGGDTRVLQIRFEKTREIALDFPNALGHIHDIASLNAKF